MSYKIKAFERAIQKIKKEEIKISERVEKARNNFFYFAKEYLPHIFTKPFAEYQIEIINYLMNDKIKGDYSIYSNYTLKFQTSRRRDKVWTYPNWLR